MKSRFLVIFFILLIIIVFYRARQSNAELSLGSNRIDKNNNLEGIFTKNPSLNERFPEFNLEKAILTNNRYSNQNFVLFDFPSETDGDRTASI
jgi:hypothetical protein